MPPWPSSLWPGTSPRRSSASAWLGAALLAAAVVPLSTAYSVTEAFDRETGLDDTFREAPFFYSAYLGIPGLGAGLVRGQERRSCGSCF